jgi:hypothetical protein
MPDIRSSSRPGGSQKILKAAVVVPPVKDFYTTRHRFSGLGVAVLGRCLAQAGCDVETFNFPLHGKKPAILGLPHSAGKPSLPLQTAFSATILRPRKTRWQS